MLFSARSAGIFARQVQAAGLGQHCAGLIAVCISDAVAKAANDTCYGLGAGIWTKDVSAMHRLAAKIKAGTVWGNCHAVIDPALPFGGYKQSGFGREQARQGVEAYTELKTVIIKL